MSMEITTNYAVSYNTNGAAQENARTVSQNTDGTAGTQTDKQARAQQFLMEANQNYAEQTAAMMGEITDGMQVAQEIYRRMASGAKVSQSDEQTLMEYDAKMYMAAKNAQMMARRHEDLSRESLTEQYEKKHANDRTDWTSELENRISELGLGPGESGQSEASVCDSADEGQNATQTSNGSFDILV